MLPSLVVTTTLLKLRIFIRTEMFSSDITPPPFAKKISKKDTSQIDA